MSGMPGIAVIGMAGRFPGAPSIDGFWQNIRNGVESISRFSDAELHAAGIDEALRRDPHYVPAGTVLEDADRFDAAFFGYHRREAESIDPQQRVFLECAWHALEAAGYDPDRFPGAVGVFAGLALNTYLLNNLLPEGESLDRLGMFHAMLGAEKDYLSTRVAYKLNLRGPALTLQTACSTSLVAIHVACQNLWTYQCDMALAGGVAVHSPQTIGYLHKDGMILSPDGHCRPFDRAAQGTVGGSGVGVVVLKRLDDALRDGDRIHAVIRGSAINNDGSSKAGFTAPSVRGQSEVIALAQAMAAIDAGSIDYVEAHGTATPLGDPIEIEALTQAFRATTEQTGYCAIGSVKSNIGHADAAAGVAGFIKAVLALEHRELPPSLHFSEPNSDIDFASSPFFVNTVLRPWPERPHPRRAGVSSFGIGGTNAHVVLEEAPVAQPSSAADGSQLLVISARTASALEQASRNLASHLRGQDQLNLADVAFTLQTGRRAFAHRRALVCRTAAGAIEAIDAIDAPGARQPIHGVHEPGTRAVIFMFPGGGAQYPGMAAGLYRQHPQFRADVDAGLRLLLDRVPHDLRSVLLADPDAADALNAMERPAIGLPLLFLVEYALARLLMSWGIRPAAMIGHSLGEYTAACLAGVVSFEDALAIVALRGRLFETLPDGEMLSVPLSEEAVRPMLTPGLGIAAVNGRELVVVSGPVGHLQTFDEQLKARGIEAVRLRITVAAHSDLVTPILGEFERGLRACRFSPPSIPFVSNVTGNWITSAQATDPAYWAQHLRHTVRFAEGLDLLLNQGQHAVVEVGPGRTLANLARQHRSDNGPVVSALRHPQDRDQDTAFLLGALGRLWVNGIAPDWNALHSLDAGTVRHRVELPLYPFERERFWIVPPSSISRPLHSDDAATDPFAVDMHGPMAVPESASTPPAASRRQAILDTLTRIVHDMSGLTPSELRPDATFLELGFDSLFLTQLTQAFRNTFKVPLKFRRLLEDLSTLGRLADHLDATLPPEAFRPTASPERANRANPAKPENLDAGSIISRQLEIMTEQLAVLRGEASSPALLKQIEATDALAASIRAAIPADAIPSQAGRAPRVPPAEPATSTEDAPQRFGPYEAIDTRADTGLTPQQQAHLDRLIARYTERTKGSKELTQQYRGVLADPRAVTGFRPQWKEMIYQIAMTRSAGSRMWDVDGNEYVDFTMGFGVNLFGHSPAFVNDAIERQLHAGLELGVLSPLAGQVSQLVCELTGFDRVTFANTGSDAILGAIRAARAVTGRDLIVMFAGGYHGMNDEVMVKSIASASGSRRSVPAAAGVPRKTVENVLVLDYDDPSCLDQLRARAGELAAVLVEPIQSRRPSVQPRELLHSIREITAASGTALIFDELITGFRLHPGGAQAWFDVKADLATYGKVISGGVPMAVIAGRTAFMDAFDGGTWSFGDASTPEAGVTFYGSTFTRHPLGLASAHAVLSRLKQEGPALQEGLNARTGDLAHRLIETFERFESGIRVEHCGSLFQIKYPDDRDNPFAQLSSWERLLPYYLRLQGIHVWDRAAFLSTAHTEADVDALVDGVNEALEQMRLAGFLKPSPSSVAVPAAVHVPEEPIAVGEARSFALTAGQAEVWLAAQMEPDASAAYNESAVLRLRGVLDRTSVERAVAVLVARHEALRTTFSADGTLQHVAPQGHLDVAYQDVTGLSADDYDSALDVLLSADSSAPFDLEAGPLSRVLLVKLEENHHVLAFTVHHIVCDGASFGRVLSELSALYSAFSRGSKADLPPAVPFHQFAIAEAAHAVSDEGKANESFWLERLSGELPVLQLPADRTRPASRSYHGAREIRQLDPALYASLKKTSASHGCTLVTTLLAAFQVLLHRLSGQADIIVGLPAAVQTSMGEEIVGHGTNLLPLRSVIDGNTRFVDFLRETRGLVLDAYEHQHCSVGELIRDLHVHRDASRPPLVQALFNIDRAEPLSFGALEAESLPAPREQYNFEIGFNLVEGNGALAVQCNYQPDLFDASTIERWIGHFETLLRGIVERPEQTIATLPLLSGDQRQEMLESWNATATGWTPALLHTAFEAQAERTPDAVAIIGATGTRVTYAELDARANKLAHLLQARGIRPESRVGVCLPRTPDLVVTLLAILKAGGAYVPLDPAYPASRLAAILDDGKLDLVVMWPDTSARLPTHQTPRLNITVEADAIGRQPASRPPCDASPDSLAYVLYTSGSTGRPKGVAIEHRSPANLVRWALTVYRDDELAQVLAGTSISFDLSVFELFVPLSMGGAVVIANDLLQVPHHAARDTITLLNTVPSALETLLGSGGVPASVRAVNLAGEPLRQSLVCDLLQGTQVQRVFDLYGPTEATTYATFAERTIDGPATIGRPLAGMQAYVVTSGDQPAPIGVAGELLLGGVGVARGYLHDERQTSERFVPNGLAPHAPGCVYRTGDLARWRHDGTLEFLGRQDSQVKLRGFRIELGDIEHALRRSGDVADVAVVKRTAANGEHLVAYVVLTSGHSTTAGDLRSELKQTLPEFMLPSAIVPLDALPRLSNGKLDRAALPSPDERMHGAVSTPARKPISATERVLAKIWTDILGTQTIAATDNFFDLGGHSLLAVQLVARIDRQFGVKLTLGNLVNAPTLEALARLVAPETRESSFSCLVPLRTGQGKPTLFLVSGVGSEVFAFSTLAAHFADTYSIYGLEPSAALATSTVRVQDVCRQYVTDITSVQPQGPVLLAGFCAGGTFAYELAQQLRAANREVALLVIIDHDMMPGEVLDAEVSSSEMAVSFARNLSLWVRQDLLPSGAADIVNRLRSKSRMATAWLNRRAGGDGETTPDIRDLLGMWQFPDEYVPHLANLFAAARAYRPEPYEGAILLVRPQTQPLMRPHPPGDRGWSVATGDFKVETVPGSHSTLLRDPFAGEVAERIKPHLQSALGAANGNGRPTHGQQPGLPSLATRALIGM